MIEGVVREQMVAGAGDTVAAAPASRRGFDQVLAATAVAEGSADRVPVSTMIDNGPGGSGATLQLNASGRIICACTGCGTKAASVDPIRTVAASAGTVRSVNTQARSSLDPGDVKAALAAGLRLHSQRADFLASLDPISERRGPR